MSLFVLGMKNWVSNKSLPYHPLGVLESIKNGSNIPLFSPSLWVYLSASDILPFWKLEKSNFPLGHQTHFTTKQEYFIERKTRSSSLLILALVCEVVCAKNRKVCILWPPLLAPTIHIYTDLLQSIRNYWLLLFSNDSNISLSFILPFSFVRSAVCWIYEIGHKFKNTNYLTHVHCHTFNEYCNSPDMYFWKWPCF